MIPLRIPLLLALLLVTTGCAFSPWEAETGCSDQLSVNLAQLATLDAQTLDTAPFTIALVTDTHQNLNDLAQAVRRINKEPGVAFVLVLGDITDAGLAHEFGWSCEALRELEVPRFYVIGNHDAISFGPTIFQENFAPLNYAFTFGTTRFVFYNDNVYEFPSAPDYAWMAQAAAVAPGETRTHTLGVAHSPPQTGPHTGEEATALRQFLADNGFDATLHGHRHQLSLSISEFGVIHHVVDDVAGGSYGLLTVDPAGSLAFYTCESQCVLLQPE